LSLAENRWCHPAVRVAIVSLGSNKLRMSRNFLLWAGRTHLHIATALNNGWDSLADDIRQSEGGNNSFGWQIMLDVWDMYRFVGGNPLFFCDD